MRESASIKSDRRAAVPVVPAAWTFRLKSPPFPGPVSILSRHPFSNDDEKRGKWRVTPWKFRCILASGGEARDEIAAHSVHPKYLPGSCSYIVQICRSRLRKHARVYHRFHRPVEWQHLEVGPLLRPRVAPGRARTRQQFDFQRR